MHHVRRGLFQEKCFGSFQKKLRIKCITYVTDLIYNVRNRNVLKHYYQFNCSLTCMQLFEPEEVKLANEIADTLNDKASIALFLTYCKKYKEEFLRDILEKVMALPQMQIKKSRGALFTFLVNQHGASKGSRT